MDIKRLFLAFVLSLIFMFTYSWFFGSQEVDSGGDAVLKLNDQTQNKANEYQSANTKNDFGFVPGLTFPKEKPTTVETPLMTLNVLNGGSSIGEIILKNHTGSWVFECSNSSALNEIDCVAGGDDWFGVYVESAPVTILQGSCNPCLVVEEGGKKIKVPFILTNIDTTAKGTTVLHSTSTLGGVEKHTTIYDNSYVVDHEFNGLKDFGDVSLLWSEGILPSEKRVSDEINSGLAVYIENDNSYSNLVNLNNVESLETNYSNNIGWAALWSKYFQKAITNTDYKNNKFDQAIFTHQAKKIDADNTEFIYTDMEFMYNNVGNNLSVESYIGPIDTKYLAEEKTSHLNHLFYGKWWSMGPLKKVIIWLLTFLHDFIPNYGIICILFAFIIRIFTGPLTKKSFLANQKMQALQPKIKKIQEKYKDDKQKASQETMALYKNEGVNPLGGCLPILIQMPLLIALFQAFQNTIEFRGASFLPFWITDLSQPDTIIYIDFLANVPLLGWFFAKGIALLPIIMGVVMFLNMKMTTATADGAQKFPMYLMNGFFILLFNTFPAGLNLYYTVYNILNFVQQKQLKQLK